MYDRIKCFFINKKQTLYLIEWTLAIYHATLLTQYVIMRSMTGSKISTYQRDLCLLEEVSNMSCGAEEMKKSPLVGEVVFKGPL